MMRLFMTIMENTIIKNTVQLLIILTKLKNKKMTNDTLLLLFNLGFVLFCLAIKRSKLRRIISICQQFIIPIIRNILISWLFRKDQSIHNQDLLIKKSLFWFHWLLNTLGLVYMNKILTRLSWKIATVWSQAFGAKCHRRKFFIWWLMHKTTNSRFTIRKSNHMTNKTLS